MARSLKGRPPFSLRLSRLEIKSPLFVSSLLAAALLPACSASVPATKSPEAFVVNSVTVKSYTAEKATVNIKGIVQLTDVTPLTIIKFYSSKDCSTDKLGEGIEAVFIDAGIDLQVPSVGLTSIYATTNTATLCYPFIDYKPSFDKPGVPSFRAFVPASPSRVTHTPAVFGSAPVSVAKVRFFDDASCSHLVGEGSAEAFSLVGVPANLASSVESSVYAKAVDPFDVESDCEFLAKFYHDLTAPHAPTFVSSSPASPSNSTETPKIAGTLEATATRITLYGDSACTLELASGSKDEFAAGIQVVVAANASTSLWGVAFDEAGNPSTCGFLTAFVNDTTAPTPPVYTSINPTSPTRLSVFPALKGTSSADTLLIKFFTNNVCTRDIGFGQKAAFEGSGISISAVPNGTTPIYAQSIDQAGNTSRCVYFTEYTHDSIAPDPPVFSATSPVSPTNGSIAPIVSGGSPLDAVDVKIYKDSSCLLQVGTGTADAFRETGIVSTAATNTNTMFYGATFDLVGNKSECALLTTYAHSNVIPPSPTFPITMPESPSNVTTTPWVSGTVIPIISRVQLYSDNLCHDLLGTGTKLVFSSNGISVDLSANTASDIYSIAEDVYGNRSPCALFTTYLHVDIQPSNPTFTSFTPASPNNLSTSPKVKGTAPNNVTSLLPTSKVKLYNSSLCVSQIGEGSVSDFTGVNGITINVSVNAQTSVYSKAFDAAGNSSQCVSMSAYVVDLLNPGYPTYISATPGSPSYTRTSLLKGGIGPSTDFLTIDAINIYSDSGCTTLIGTGTRAAFTSTGISILNERNTSTTVFAQSVNTVGNKSVCRSMLSFDHNDNGPGNLTATMGPSGAIGISWQADSVASPTPTYTLKRATVSGGPYTILAKNLLPTSYLDHDVSYGAHYYYVVSASNGTGTSKNSAEANATVTPTAPAAPSALVATPGYSRVTLIWSGPSNDLYFDVYRATAYSGPYTRIAANLQQANYLDTAVSNQTPYFYFVRGSNPAGVSADSNISGAVPRGLPPAPLSVTVRGVTSSAACSGNPGVVVSWSETPYYESFQVNRGDLPWQGTSVATVATTTWTDCTGIMSAKHRYYSVAGIWGGIPGTFSAEIPFFIVSPPDLTASAGDTHVNLTWTNTDSAVEFNVKRATASGGPYTVIGSAVTGISYTDSSVVNGTAYYYKVEPVYISGQEFGWESYEASAVPQADPSAPSNLMLSVLANQPNLSWSSPTHYNSFKVYRATTAGGVYTLRATTTAPSYTDAGALVGMNFYKVTATWGTYETAATSVVSFRNAVVTGVTATATLSPNKITVGWSDYSGENAYWIYRSTVSQGPYTLLTSGVAQNAVSYGDTTVSAGLSYYYVVVPSFADGTQGQYSLQVGATVATSAPNGLTVTATTISSISLAWAKVISASPTYRLYQADALAGPYSQIYSGPLTSFTATSGLSLNTPYYFKVTALVSGTEYPLLASAPVVSGTTLSPPNAPNTTPGDNTVKLTWAPVTAAVSYSISRSTDTVTFSTLASGVTATTYDDATALNGFIYYYKITAVFSGSSLTSSRSSAVTPGVLPKVPQGLTVTENADGSSLTFAWASIAGATSYNLYQALVSGGPYSVATNAGSTTNNQVTGFSSGTTYYFVVTALNGSVESAYSAEIAAIPKTSPAAPLASIVPAGTAAALTWAAVAGASTYEIQRSDDTANFATIANGVATASYTDSTLLDQIPYTYRYLPRDASGVAMAWSLASLPVSRGIRPMTPSSLIASSQSTSSVTLSWIASTNVVSYSVYRGTASAGPYSKIASVLIPNTSYVDATVVAGNTYYYVVTSVNASNVDSLNSNEVSLNLSAAPVGLGAVLGTNQINLTWTPTGGATSYLVHRSTIANGPYTQIASGVGAASYADNGINSGSHYYYVVNAVYASGAVSPDSNEANVVATTVMNLEVPIELTDSTLGSSSSSVVFERTRTSLDTSAYDGTVTYTFEVVAQNSDSVGRDITLLDAAGVVKATITVPAGTVVATRLRSALTPNAGLDTYRIQLGATNSDLQLSVASARALVKQVGASRTKIYIPLLSGHATASLADAESPVESTNLEDYAQLLAASIFKKDSTHYADFADYLPFEFETLVSASGGAEGTVAILNTNRNEIIDESEAYFDGSAISMINSSFNNGALNFGSINELEQFQVSISCLDGCLTGTARIYKAGLWVTLVNLSKAEVLYRNSLGANAFSATTQFDAERTKVDLSVFSNPVFKFQGVGKAPASGNLALQLMNAGTSDSGLGGLSAVGSSALSFTSTSKSCLRSPSLTLSTGDRVISEGTPSTASTTFVDSALIVQTTR